MVAAMYRPRWVRPTILGIIATLALISALAAFSFYITAQMDATFLATGIDPASLHAYQPSGERPG
jgi:hypothetical protein